MKGVSTNRIIMGIGVLVIIGLFIWPFLKVEEHTRSEITESNADIVARDLSIVIGLLSTVEQGVQIYDIPRESYELELTPLTIRVTDKDVYCEKGCSFTYEHNSKYVQASHILPGVKNVCVVKKYIPASGGCNAPIVYICDAEGKDLRCNCELGDIKDCIDNDRLIDKGEPCKLELIKLDNYGEVGDENTVSMTVNAKDCEGMYISPFGMPYVGWKVGLDTPNDFEEDKFNALRYKKTKDCVDKIDSSKIQEYLEEIKKDKDAQDKTIINNVNGLLESCLKDDRNSRTIGDNEKEKEITVEYVCKGKGNNFLFDLAALPGSKGYVIDTFARIQNIVGCGEKPEPHTCVDGCEINEIECPSDKFGSAVYYCNRKGSVFANFCVNAYYDVNCVPS